MIGTRLWVTLVMLGLAGKVATLLPEDLEERDHRNSYLQEECASRCPDLELNQNRTDDASTEVGCGVRCKTDQCTKGCAAWRQALETSCQAVCNGTQDLLPPRELYCVLGCHDALNRYFQQLKAEIGVPPAPALVADSLTATSLRLEWKGIDVEKRRGGGISYLVQWRYEELAETWQYCRNQSWGEDDQILVENLQPYTKYRFRVALLLKSTQHNPEPIVSAPSVVILTLASGRPTSAPVIVRAAAVDSCRVSVSWEPGPFPNGPLASYVLQLRGADYSLLNKDIPASENTDHYMFQNLEPNKNYTISVSMRNAVGDGPPAVIYITTPPEPAVKDMQQPILILGGEHVVMKQGADMLDEPRQIYHTSGFIRGVAIHVASAQLFVSDSMGYVYRTSILEPAEPTVVLSPGQVNFKPLSLSVDWLNMHLYVLGEVKHATTVWQIARCNFDGKGLTVAMAGFLTRPSHIEVDPYNGYLFWVTRGGLFRLDLADISNGIKHEVQPYLILEDAHLGAFTVDHTNFRLLVPDHTQNTVISVSLDGREILNLRANTQQPKFKNVVSLAMANGLFYWTNGEEVLTEGYHSGQNRYFHNAFPDRSDGSFVSVNVLMDASQPVPVPVNPPTGVQAVLGSKRAKVSWQAPHLLGGQGKGAWQNWSYELEIKDESSGKTFLQTAIAGSSHTVYDLREKSEYTIKAAAYTSSGRGPWSTEFRGRTLKDGSHASILWSANEGLLRSDVTGENIETLIYKESLRDYENEYYIVDVSWYKDTLYLVGNNSILYRYNVTNHEKTRLNINSVGSVAVDWISKKLYWANPKQQIITRANLNGSQQEPMSILAIVKELMIDAQAAYLYWSTGHAVEVARLNGQDRRYYHTDEIFNGKQVMGLTLDTENRYVYWIVRSYESGSIVYRAPTSERIPFNRKIVPEKVSSLQHPNMRGPLCYFSEHLLWLQDDRNTVIGDLSGQNTAIINGISLIGLHMVSIMDPALHRYPGNLTSDTIMVLPNAVTVDSIRVVGSWRNFNVSWDPVTNINYGTVFYEVKFADYINTNSKAEITTENWMPYNNSEKILPYSILEVTVKAFTYWGTAIHARTILRSPQSVPSQPTNVRSFVEFNREPLEEENDVSITFRWDEPEFKNGLIEGYEIQCWSIIEGNEIEIGNDIKVGSEVQEYLVNQLKSNTTYYFKVRGLTQVGAGPYSETLEISTEYENPVPQLLAVTNDAVKLIDLDRRSNETITRQAVAEIRYLAVDNKLYWINEMRQIMTSDLRGNNATKMLSLNGTSWRLCVDWVARNLYWSESSYNGRTRDNRIMKLDLTAWEGGTIINEEIVTRSANIVNIDISPLTGDLYWIELIENDRGMIMRSDLHGEDVRHFFDHSEDCSCPYRQSVKPSIAVDITDSQNPVVYWVSLDGNLNIAEIDGCACNPVLLFDDILPPVSLTVDKINVYWTNLSGEKIHYINKDFPNRQSIKIFDFENLQSIVATGKSLQPYPSADCLIPHQVVYNVEQVSKTSTSITVKLPRPEPHFGCESYNLPGTLYTIYVSQCLENDPNDCETSDKTKLQTYKREIQLRNLKPFTKYRIKLALSNHYGDSESLSLEFGPGVVLRTAAGVPTTPENVTVEALTPTSAAVHWLPPRQLNAAAVRYEIHWRSVRLVNGFRQKGEQLIKNSEKPSDGKFSAMLQPLLPGQDYLVYVRAYPAHFSDAYSESSGIHVTMHPEPNNLTLIGVSVNALNLSWIPTVNLTVSYSLEFTTVGLEKWQVANEKEIKGNKVEYHIRGLLSRSLYKFRLVLRYPTYKQDFIWPTDARFTFQTLGDVPSAPGTPTVTKLRNSVYQLNWEPARAHGSQVTLYRLEGKIIDDATNIYERNETDRWTLYYNGTDNYWIIMGEMNEKYSFRVQARNAYGFGGWSEASSVVDLTDTTGTFLAGQQHLGLVLGLSVPVIAIMLLCFCYFLCAVYKQRKEDKKAVLPPIMPDLELATLREIPRGNFVQSNALYASSLQQDHDDAAMLPKIRRQQITLAKFLGRGAFGEVYQGSAKDLNGPGITPVAIKTLRKGSTAREKSEFLQEAQLMSQFHHKHVIHLLGVCLDTDAPLLVLELMEAGDLLEYLRSSRSLTATDSRDLLLQDLLAMCEDVARGCRYLEELHFVHRDLACRNCLVSARDRKNRVVKIADFGLARDVYKNDYYRKVGEGGLLPVRWMAPESLFDGVFTSQSDVWAFGVIMWEITSLGQQPYHARTNTDVMHYVRSGGRLSKPLNCPPLLHQLMLACWSHEPEARPSFKSCLEHIIALRSNTVDAPLSPVYAGHYLTRRGVSNMAYFADENENHNDSAGNSWKSSSSEGSRDMQPFLQDSNGATTTLPRSFEPPKYIEVLPSNDQQIDQYETPRSINISINNQEQDSNSLQKRSSATSLNLTDRRRISLTNIREKSKTLDNLRTTPMNNSSALKDVSPLSLNELEKKTNDTNDTNFEVPSCSPFGSSIDSAPSTRPSSSLINPQQSLPISKNNNNNVLSSNREIIPNDTNATKTQKLITKLHNSKADIPLVMNTKRALSNLLAVQPQQIEDNNTIVTPSYTNLNSNVTLVN